MPVGGWTTPCARPTCSRRAGQPRWQVTALQAAGYAAIWADPERSEELLDRAHRLALEHALPAVAVAVTATRAKLDWRRGRLEDAIAGYRRAVADSGGGRRQRPARTALGAVRRAAPGR